ncbi:MAG: apolipoprotein N-acyltransferase [Bacteroidetes bacterium]|nr:apolipoprotein N-acyltransferase [Bacteroidota bacterium]
MKKYHLILLSVLSGLILSAGWPARGFPLLLFFGFVPFLFIEDFILKKQTDHRFSNFSVFLYTFPGFLTWNILTTWWIYNSTDIGAILAFLLNSTFMAGVFTISHVTRRSLKNPDYGYIVLIAYWMTFEYIHLNWEISWPWLNLGNGFASYYKWIQWYEYTGTFGGTLWILLVNILIFRIIKQSFQERVLTRSIRIQVLSALLIIIIPIVVSLIMFNRYQEKLNPVHVVVVQPNLDPYSEQYGLDPTDVIDRILKLSDQKTDSLTDFVVCPESAIQDRPLYEDQILFSRSYKLLNDYVKKYPDLQIVIGASTYKIFNDNEPLSHTARKFHDAEKYYDAYNTAILISPNDTFQLYHKSKLTPGVEIMPYSEYLKFLEKMTINLGGTVGSLGTDNERRPFSIPSKSLKVAPAICYESAYGEFCGQFVKNGANLIFVITNDGWWGNTPGHRQHLTFSSLRAIETRRSIARSANTGISAFIDQRGTIHQATAYWEQAVIKADINANSGLTFYVKYGDFIARIATFVSIIFILITVSIRIVKAISRKVHY